MTVAPKELGRRLVWKIRNISSNPNGRFSISAQERALINKAYPNGSVLLDRYIQQKADEQEVKEFANQLLNSVVDEQITAIKGLAQSVEDLWGSAQDISNTIQQLEAKPAPGVIPRDNSDYSLLSKGVATRVNKKHGGISPTTVEFVNSTDRPYTFVPKDYSLQSSREVQRLGLGAYTLPSGSSSGLYSIAMDSTPYIGSLKSLLQALTGKDLLTSNTFSYD